MFIVECSLRDIKRDVQATKFRLASQTDTGKNGAQKQSAKEGEVLLVHIARHSWQYSLSVVDAKACLSVPSDALQSAARLRLLFSTEDQ